MSRLRKRRRSREVYPATRSCSCESPRYVHTAHRSAASLITLTSAPLHPRQSHCLSSDIKPPTKSAGIRAARQDVVSPSMALGIARDLEEPHSGGRLLL